MKNQIALVGILMLFTGFLNAQNTFSISGTISNATHQKLEAIVISLLLTSDNSLVKTALSEPDGSFQIGNLSGNNYTLIIEDPAYKLYKSEPIIISKSNIQLPEIKLIPLEKTSFRKLSSRKRSRL
ncbi:carboxypeptidase-like regulatory domain-containing protein [Flavobacterium sp. 3HN19-14]|uniref:carboxypeptidase-like regulatory domain-containing protein n=1 Tax=Flavobacterium sp. 3HN19-14 TaxID=3448133 RepID=UPI003EE14B17